MGVRRLCIGLYHDAAQTSFVYCVRPGRIYCIRRDEYRLVPWGTHVIRRSILFALPCPPIYLTGLAHFPMPWWFLSGAGVWLGCSFDRPLGRGHEVAGLPCHALVMQVLPPLIGVVTCVSASSWRGVRVHTLWPQGLQSICQLANLGKL